MANLIPEKRTDRNGRLVTRHVSPPAAPSTEKRAIPAAPALRSTVDEVLAFQKLYKFQGVTTPEQMRQLYPVADPIASAIECSGEPQIRDLLIYMLSDRDPDWMNEMASVCHFINRVGGVNDAVSAWRAIVHLKSFHHTTVSELSNADETVQSHVTEVLDAVMKSGFAMNAVSGGGSQTADIKTDELMEYLSECAVRGSLQEKIPALLELDNFIDFNMDEHEEEPALANLDYVKLVELMEYVRNETKVSPEGALDLVRRHEFNVDEVRSMIENYDGSSALIEGSL